MQIKKKKLEELVIDEQNIRLHNEQNIMMIVNSLKEYGQWKPLIIQKGSNKVLCGNGRLEAMKILGWKECECIQVQNNAGLSIIDNRLNELSFWKDERLYEWLRGEEGWWGIDEDIQKILNKKKKKKERKERVKKVEKYICPCCGKELKKEMVILDDEDIEEEIERFEEE